MEELVRKNNPWWQGEEDRDVKVWSEMRINWIPNWIYRLSLTPFSLNVIVGPRQVGKTTGVKVLIAELLEKEKPESIFYFNCDFLTSPEDLRLVLDLYLSMADSLGLKKRFIFLDEVAGIAGWWRAVKGYIDLGKLDNAVVTILGSSSLRLKGEVELFPGRRGKGREIPVLPLNFREFSEVHEFKLERSDEAVLYKRELLGLFEQYLKVGGFPLSINQEARAEEYLLASIEGEVLRAGRSWRLSRAILASIFKKAPSPLSFSSIGADIGISYKTVEDYLDLFKRLFILDLAFYRHGDRIIWRKEKKVFFLDPFMAVSLSHWCGERFLDAALYEWVVQAHISRKFGEVFYYRDYYEVDCIAGDLKVEVKAGKPHRRYPRGVKVLEYEDVPLFLYALGPP